MIITPDLWNEVTKGSRRPVGRVLVSHDATSKAERNLHEAIHGEAPPSKWTISVARWDRGAWRNDRGQIIEGVTHWMEMPEPKGVGR